MILAEYIEREALLNHLKHRVAPMSDGEQLIKGVNLALEILEEAVEMLPAADVAPVVHGQWLNIDGDYTFASCSICEEDCEVATEVEAEKGLWDAFLSAYRYCPNCGAKMDGEVNGICADDKQSLKTCRTCKNYTPNHGYRDGEMGTCCFWKSITGNCMAVYLK